jgi:hypothetical protein
MSRDPEKTASDLLEGIAKISRREFASGAIAALALAGTSGSALAALASGHPSNALLTGTQGVQAATESDSQQAGFM